MRLLKATDLKKKNAHLRGPGSESGLLKAAAAYPRNASYGPKGVHSQATILNRSFIIPKYLHFQALCSKKSK